MTDTVNVQLLPCPFCGGEASIERYGNTRVSTQYHCDDCGCFLETGEEFNHGRSWNTRATLAAAPKVEQDYSEMKRLAEGASPGPWKACGTIYEHMNCEIRTGSKGEGQPIGQIWDGPNAFADGQFIAAASPEIVLGLIARASSPAPASYELLEAIDMDDFNIVGKWIESGEKGGAPSGRVKGLWQSMRRVIAIAKHKGPQS